ncbi:MAG: FAD-dependent oxidoreductase [Candidatus Eremiobacteraeota bacterium]|nr:FAD-dependent oxidoreductase [Candidatus Eremiobacteraeota bacterium]
MDQSEEKAGTPRVGVYLCHCGGNISDVVDIEGARNLLLKNSPAATVKDYPFMCSDPGQGLIIEDIRKNGIDRVVVAACSPALHELTFRNALQRAGLNAYLYEHVNIREQVSWVHKEHKDKATEKAVRLIRAGIEKVMRHDPLTVIQVNAEHHAVVIGAGPAGMKAALSLADRGIGVTLIEKDETPGGHLKELATVFPTAEEASVLLERFKAQVASRENISLLCGTRVTDIDGYVGNFTVKTDKGHVVKAGVIIIATGFRHYSPYGGEMAFQEASATVVTLPAFIKGLSEVSGRDGTPVFAGRVIKSIAFIHCVGSMQREGLHQPGPEGRLNDYCSRYCCAAVLHSINDLLDRFPSVQVYDVYKDIRTYGRGQEQYYEDASKKGVLFFRCSQDMDPSVTLKDGSCEISLKDVLTWNEEVVFQADLVVLATGMMPGELPELVDSLKLPLGSDGFLQEVHPKLRPVELANSGVFIAGTCQGPMTVPEACAAAEAAAVKASILLSSPMISLDPFVAEVDKELCTGCGLCMGECSYKGALALTEDDSGKKHARVNPALCKGCGACAAVCPHRAIAVAGWTLDQFDAMIDAITATINR